VGLQSAVTPATKWPLPPRPTDCG